MSVKSLQTQQQGNLEVCSLPYFTSGATKTLNVSVSPRLTIILTKHRKKNNQRLKKMNRHKSRSLICAAALKMHIAMPLQSEALLKDSIRMGIGPIFSKTFIKLFSDEFRLFTYDCIRGKSC